MPQRSSKRRPAKARPRLDAPASVADRLPLFVDGPSNAVEILAGKRVAFVGAGSVGMRLISHMARLGLSEVRIVDSAAFKPQSVLTHEIPLSAIGAPKADWVADYCRAISPPTKVIARRSRIQMLPLSFFADSHIVIVASDNLQCERAAGEIASSLGIPLLQASVHGETLTAQVRFLANAGPGSACKACEYTSEEWVLHDDEAEFACSGGQPTIHTRPTMSAAFLCSMAADLGATLATRYFLGLGKPVTDSLLSWNGYTNHTLISPLSRNPRCRCPHGSVWAQAALPLPLAECTVNELLAAAQMNEQSVDQIQIEVEGSAFAEQAFCCGQQPINQFLANGEAPSWVCATCQMPLVVPPYFMRAAAPLEKLNQHVSLHSLGVASTTGVLLSDGKRGVLARFSQDVASPPQPLAFTQAI